MGLQPLYGGTSGAGSLYTIDPKTGAVTLVHALVGASNASLTYGVTGLAFQPGTGILYGSTSPDSPNSGNSLVTINPANGQVTVIGGSGTGRPYTDIAFAPNGTLYGWLIGSDATTISAVTINLTNGAGASLGSPQTPSALPDGGGLAVSSSGVIYVAANGHVGAPCSPTTTCSGALWTINPASGAPTTVGILTGGPAPTITALAFSPSGILYGIEGGDGGASWNLITINIPGMPIITTVSNAASNISPALPNGGVAQGGDLRGLWDRSGSGDSDHGSGGFSKHRLERHFGGCYGKRHDGQRTPVLHLGCAGGCAAAFERAHWNGNQPSPITTLPARRRRSR
ncbi:MAG TPA: hypothetical protein VGJ21_22315 [Terracidiphilus sp.]